MNRTSGPALGVTTKIGHAPTVLRWWVLLALAVSIALVFVVRTNVARTGNAPRLFELFDLFTTGAAAVILLIGFRTLTP